MRVQTTTTPYDQWDNLVSAMLGNGWELKHFNSLYKWSAISSGELLMYSGVFTKED